MKNDLNRGIICNVKNCVFNEKGTNCNLERVTISKGEGKEHFCKSYISSETSNSNLDNINIEAGNDITINENSSSNINEEEYFNFDDLLEDVSTIDDAKYRDNNN